jgi:hypothetical protein
MGFLASSGGYNFRVRCRNVGLLKQVPSTEYYYVASIHVGVLVLILFTESLTIFIKPLLCDLF